MNENIVFFLEQGKSALDDFVAAGKSFGYFIALIFNVGTNLWQDEGSIDMMIATCQHKTKFRWQQPPTSLEPYVIAF